MRNLIKKLLNEQSKLNEAWFHGTPDVREIEKQGEFSNKIIKVDYVINPNGLKELQKKINNAYQSDDKDLYFKLLDKASDYKEYYTYNKPLFLTDKYSVAKTYADPKRAFDYQEAKDKVLTIDVNCDKIVTINAVGDRFRFISVDKVKKGFIKSGVSEDEIDKLISMFNYYIPDNKGIKTDVIAAIGNWLRFDCIDVVGVLDSYQGGNIKSTVRMVLDPTKVKIINNINENKYNSIGLSEHNKYGSYEGIIHFETHKIKNWFEYRKINYEKYLELIKYPVAFLNNINVDYKHRNKGYGNSLYLNFEQECYDNDVNCIILECDNDEEQKKGFNLKEWYISLDFEVIGNENGNFIMIKYL